MKKFEAGDGLRVREPGVGEDFGGVGLRAESLGGVFLEELGH